MNDVYWEIIYYGTGMSPQTATFTNEQEALATWEKWSADPYKGASCLHRIEKIRTISRS